MQDNQEKCKELAIRIYNLDEEVYKCVGSSLGRTFTGQKETTLRHLAALMYTKPDGHLLRSELALISNMARTIRDKSERRRLMIEYDSILKEIESLPDTFGQTDIVDKERISLNNLIARRQNEISENDHLIICISRTQGSGGNDIGFELADELQINYYDAEIFDQVMKRLQADKNAVSDTGNFEGFDKYRKKKHTLYRVHRVRSSVPPRLSTAGRILTAWQTIIRIRFSLRTSRAKSSALFRKRDKVRANIP